MIKNWFKKENKITFSCDERFRMAFLYCKPDYAGKFMPEWFKKLPLTYDIKNEFGLRYSQPTVRSCYGIRKTITNGFILPLWTDIIIEVNPDGWKAQCSDKLTQIGQHDLIQHTGLFENFVILKICSPWIIQSKKTTSLYLTQPVYHSNHITDYFILPGIVSFNSHPTATNVFIVISIKNETQRIELKCNSPFVQYINTTDDVLKLETKLIDREKFQSFARILSFRKNFDNCLKWAKSK